MCHVRTDLALGSGTGTAAADLPLVAQARRGAHACPARAAISQAAQAAECAASWRKSLLLLLLTIIWLCTLLAIARPVWIGEPVSLPTSGRDILLAVDISGSMEREDMQLSGQTVNRLMAVKAVVGNFVAEREGDRLGLILFGEKAYLQTPLTFDRKTMQTLLYEAQLGICRQWHRYRRRYWALGETPATAPRKSSRGDTAHRWRQ